MSELGWKFSVTFKIPACAQHPKFLRFPTVSLLQDFLSHPGVLCGNSTTKYKIPGNFNNLQCRAMAITEDVFYIKKYPHISYTINLGLMLIRASNAHMILSGNYG